MSDHRIEDFTEFAVQRIAGFSIPGQEKRQLFYHLYRYQNHFDASYTVLRNFETLRENNFIQKLPISRHPDFELYQKEIEALPFQYGEWIPDDYSQPENEVVYAQKENGETVFFPQYGSEIWRRLYPGEEKIEDIKATSLFAQLLSLSVAQEDNFLLKQTYSALLYGYFSDINQPENGYPTAFSDWLKDEDLLKIREYLSQIHSSKNSKKDNFFPKISLKEELEIASPKEEAKIRFLLDEKISVQQLEHLNEKNNQQKEIAYSKIALIDEVLEKPLSGLGWHFSAAYRDEVFGDEVFIWQKETDTKPHAQFLVLKYIDGLKGISVKEFLQHALLLQWQEKKSDADYHNAHFQKELLQLLTEEEQRKYEKKFNYLGVWRYDIKKSEKELRKNLTELAALLLLADGNLLARVNQYFPDKFFKKSDEDFVVLFDEMMFAPDDLLFDSLHENLLVLIFHAAQQNDFAKARHTTQLLINRLPERHKKENTFYMEHHQPFLEQILRGEKAPLPKLREFL